MIAKVRTRGRARRLPGARDPGPRRRLDRRDRRGGRGRRRGRPASRGRPGPRQPGQGGAAQVGFRRPGTSWSPSCDADTHLHPLALKLLVSRMLRSTADRRRRRARRTSPTAAACSAPAGLEAASIIGLIRRTGRSAGGSASSPASSGSSAATRCSPSAATTGDGDRGHRPLLAPAARRLAHGLRAEGPRRHGGALDPPVPVGAAVPVGARARARSCTTTWRGRSLAQPADVAARARVGRLAGLGVRRSRWR